MLHEKPCVQTFLHLPVSRVPDKVRAEIRRLHQSQGESLPEDAAFCWVMPHDAIDSFDSMCDWLALARDMATREEWPEPYDGLRQSSNFLDALDICLREAMNPLSPEERVQFCRDALIREPAVWSLPTWVSLMRGESPEAMTALWAKVGEATRAYDRVSASRASRIVPVVEAAKRAASFNGVDFVVTDAIIDAAGADTVNEIDSARRAYYGIDTPKAFIDGKKMATLRGAVQVCPCVAHLGSPPNAVIPVQHETATPTEVRSEGNMTGMVGRAASAPSAGPFSTA